MIMASEKTPLIRSGRPAEQRGASEQLDKATISTSKSKKQPKFNWLFLKRLHIVLRVAVPGLCSKSLLLLAVLILARSAEEYNYYQMGIIPSKFYLALTSKNIDIFKEALWKMAVIITSVCICKSGGELVAGLVYVRWRATITRYLHARYFSGITYYILNTTDQRIDNPDQRITQDVDRFCNQISQLLPKIIIQPFLIVYYSYRTFVGLGWYGVLGVYLFFALSTLINKFIMSPIVSVIFQQERKEGDFRFHHTQVRANAEAIAFYQGGENEREKANKLLRVLLKTQLKSVHWQFPLNFSVFMFDYASTVISYSLIGVAVFMGKYDNMSASDLASSVSMNSFFSLYLLNGFSKLVDTAVSFAEVAGFTHRLGELIEVLKEMEREDKKRCGSGDKEEESGGLEGMANKSQPSDCQLSLPGSAPPLLPKVSPACLETVAVVNNLTLSPPHSKHTLAQDLSFNFTKGCNILILGETGTGKTALLRVLRKLWKPVTGFAQLCCDGSHHYVMFLPQKTYLTSGSLASQHKLKRKGIRNDRASLCKPLKHSAL
ncbi:lysosomal cobalamin transporter ABCD4-like isoform X3 [Halichondria panicea]|uniref:lysosomal cobalamin transporter ABCD4-like isoform X3 n=1 Tax=Halichondria panicea TaxID=6063 RepID=UPI00312B8465